MFVDRYTKAVLSIIALSLSLLAGNVTYSHLAPRQAEAQPSKTVPKAWGKPFAATPVAIFFEAPDGTVRGTYAERGDIVIRRD